MIQIRPFTEGDLPGLLRLWQQTAESGEVLLKSITEADFRRLFLTRPDCPDCLPVAVDPASGDLAGFAHFVTPASFPNALPGKAYLTVLMVDSRRRHEGIGSALLSWITDQLQADTLSIASVNPVNLTWRIPDTPGHDHNNMPGLDRSCPAYDFFVKKGFRPVHTEVAMYMPLAGWQISPEIGPMQARLRESGIETGIFTRPLDLDFDGMCDRVGSEYWRDVLRTELKAWKTGEPNPDPRFWPDGRKPAGPRPLLLAVHEDRIVGFTGPVDLQSSGRGWFTGICTDPLYARRGIATVLFSLLMQAFADEGAAFTTLFTGTDNRAQRIYRAAGLRPVRAFDHMILDLSKDEQNTEEST